MPMTPKESSILALTELFRVEQEITPPASRRTTETAARARYKGVEWGGGGVEWVVVEKSVR